MLDIFGDYICARRIFALPLSCRRFDILIYSLLVAVRKLRKCRHSQMLRFHQLLARLMPLIMSEARYISCCRYMMLATLMMPLISLG